MGLDRKAVEYAALEREAAGNRQLYENLLQRAKETGVSGEFKGSNIEIVDAAEVPRWPGPAERAARPDDRGASAGCLLAFGLVVRLRVLRQPHQDARRDQDAPRPAVPRAGAVGRR